MVLCILLMEVYYLLLQLCSGVDESAPGACAQLVFAPIDESFSDDAPLLPSGFRVIPLDGKAVSISVLNGLLLEWYIANATPVIHYMPKLQDVTSATRTLDLASALEVGSGGALHVSKDTPGTGNVRSVLTIAFQFSFENHLRERVAVMAKQYIRAVMTCVQRISMSMYPSRIGSQIEMKHPPGSPEAQTLARWISRSYRWGLKMLSS
jgi:homeobox-leucine zipper protein